ncbi:GNAT family N-acetyltransferase [Oceanibium sediminis]|uniref:GNAT family N-acetyltransferase n=1 Tax=Oceanibium sediminis TaxID=2026339 RepID=UPI000DD4A3C8|nr:GNAT family protein [Oceanibium sediminis]
MFRRRPRLKLLSERLILRLPDMADHAEWVMLRENSTEFLERWEPVRASEQTSRRSFRNRVYWAERSLEQDRAVPLFLTLRATGTLLGGITLDNIRRGPSQAATVGYWIGAQHARHGYMREALQSVVRYAFSDLGLSRIEAATLPENAPSRGLLESTGFKYEGVAQSYLQIAGRWRTHVLYANLRSDRRGRVEGASAGAHAPSAPPASGFPRLSG